MDEAEAYIRAAIHTWVWSGFYGEDDMVERLDDILEPEVDADAMRAAIADELSRKTVAEQNWPAITDCDRLDAVFAVLNTQGICALQNTGLTQSDGIEDIRAASAGGGYHGYCFYHGQDLERAVAGQGLYLAFGPIKPGGDGLAVGEAVRAALEARAFVIEWDGTTATRIFIPAIDWKRRTR